MKLPKPISFEWDTGNKDKNVTKHQVKNSETEEVFGNSPVIMPDRTHSQTEERYHAFGVTNKQRKLIISFVLRGSNKEKVRPIMSRDQNKKERAYYKKESEVKHEKTT